MTAHEIKKYVGFKNDSPEDFKEKRMLCVSTEHFLNEFSYRNAVEFPYNELSRSSKKIAI